MAVTRNLIAHGPSRDDNVDKARGLARFAERHGARFGHIQIVRQRRSTGGAERFVRLKINRRGCVKQVLLPSTAAQLDRLFDGVQ